MPNKYKKESRLAQEERKKWKTCEKKKAFNTEDEAKEQKGQRVYKCPYCNKWHRSGAFAKLINKVSRSIGMTKAKRKRFVKHYTREK